MSPVNDPDVLIVGGGIVGLFCAHHLREAGASVAIVERGPVGGRQSCSAGNTGFFGTQGATPFAGPFDVMNHTDETQDWLSLFERARSHSDDGLKLLLELKRRSLDLLKALRVPTSGVVLAFKSPEALRRVRHGPIPMRVLPLEEVPGLDACGALYHEDGGFVRSRDFVMELARRLDTQGVRIHEHTDVIDVETTRDTVTRVRTDRGDFRPRETVIAAGAWSAHWARRLGIELALLPVKGYSVTVKAPPGAPQLPILLSDGHVAVAPLGDRLRFGGVMELSTMDTAVAPSHVEQVLRTVAEYLPRLQISEPVDVWCGFRPCTPDSLPFLGRARPYRNLSFACGHGHIGMGTAPFSGKLIAQLLGGQATDIDLEPFRLDRFTGDV